MATMIFFIPTGDSREEKCVLESDNYDLNNQLTYPVKVSEGNEVYF